MVHSFQSNQGNKRQPCAWIAAAVRFFYFWIWQTGSDIFSYDPMKRQKMVKLPEGPDSGFCDMNEAGVVVGCKIDQMMVTNPIDRPDSMCFQKVF
jgi:hypothetical protein